MRIPRAVGSLIVVVALASPPAARAGVTLSFSGAVSPGSLDRIFPYLGPGALDSSFDGQPLTIEAHVVGKPGSLYVDWFQVKWSDLTSPFLTRWSDSGGAPFSEADVTTADFVSSADINGAGGDLETDSSNYYVGQKDGSAALQLSYVSDPSGAPSGGSGRFTAFINQGFDPTVGPYDEQVSIPFTLAYGALTAVPEPAEWTSLGLGFAGLGWACRARARRVLRSSAPG